jgi:hypothetical protein
LNFLFCLEFPLNDALSHTSQADCGELFFPGDEDPSLTTSEALEATTYWVEPLNPGVGAQTVNANTVFLNSNGAFFNAGANANGTVSVRMPNANGVFRVFTFANLATLEGFLILHELGHQVGLYGPDVNRAANGQNSQLVLSNCFTMNAQGSTIDGRKDLHARVPLQFALPSSDRVRVGAR